MPVINNLPFESKYGFKSPSFTVDELGNINATSITLVSSSGLDTISDFIVTEVIDDVAGNNGFSFVGFLDLNPVINLQRTKTYFFSIDTPELTFSFYELLTDEIYTTGVTHSDGSRGSDAKEKSSGIYTFRVPADAPDSLTYRGRVGPNDFIQGQITISDPDGIFGTVDITTDTNSTDAVTGALTVAGGVGIAKDLFVGDGIFANALTLNSLIQTPAIESNTTLDLSSNSRIIFKIDSSTIGFIDGLGTTIPVNSTTIDNTVIGSVTPSTANFTAASVAEIPTTGTGVANKNYVDQSAVSFSIAFGL